MPHYPKKSKSQPTYESQHFSGVVVADPENNQKNKIRINDEMGYFYFVNRKCKRGDIVSVYYTNKRPKRTELQKRYYFEYLSLISLSSGHTVEELHAWVKGKFLSKGITEIFGSKVRRVRSTNQLSITEMAELIERIEEITGIPAPPTDLFKMPHSHEQHEKMRAEQKKHYKSLKPSKKLKI